MFEACLTACMLTCLGAATWNTFSVIGAVAYTACVLLACIVVFAPAYIDYCWDQYVQHGLS
jgi:hypothetical protein